MDNTEFDALIRDLRERPAPVPPRGMETRVLRRVRLSKAGDVRESEWGWLGHLVGKSAFAGAAITLSVATGVGVSILATSGFAAEREHRVQTLQHLGFDSMRPVEVISIQQGQSNS